MGFLRSWLGKTDFGDIDDSSDPPDIGDSDDLDGSEFSDGTNAFDDLSDVKPPRNKAWIILLLIFAVLGAGGVFLYMQYLKDVEEQNIAQLLQAAQSMEREDQAKAYRTVLSSNVHKAHRRIAAEKLGQMGDQEAIPLLLSSITDTEELSQSSAVALGRMAESGRLGEGDKALARDKIFPQMEAAQKMAKTFFAFSLALLGDERCIESLLQGYMEDEQSRSIEGLDASLIARFASVQKMIALTKSEDPAIRMLAAQSIGQKRAKEGVQSLTALLNDSNKSVIQTASESLAKVDPAAAGPELIKLLKREPDMQKQLVIALRDAVGAPGLKSVYDNSDDWDLKLLLVQHLRAPPPPGREQAPDVPRGIGDPRAGDMCDHFYNNFPGKIQQQKEMGLWCLEELGDPRARDGLFKIAQEEFSVERDPIIDGCIKSIGYINFEGSQDFLLDLLKQGKGRPATVLTALGRIGDAKIGRKIERFTHCPESEVTSGGACDRETALRVLGRIRWPGALKLLSSVAERRSDDKVATRIESRDIWQEFRLRERIGALEGLAHLGDSNAAELLMRTMEDVQDDPQIRLEAARALAFSINDEVVETVLTKIRDTELDVETRKYYIAALWHRPSAAAIDSLFDYITDVQTPPSLLITAGFAIGEAGVEAVNQERLRETLQQDSTERLVPACLAAIMSGDDETISELIPVLENRLGLEAQVRDRYSGPSGHPVYLTDNLFESGRLYRRLRNAYLLRQADQGQHGWAWQHLTSRLLEGTADWPNGLSTYEIRTHLANDVRSNENQQWRQMAAITLLRMGYRGYVLSLAAEDGPGAQVARDVLAGRDTIMTEN